MIRIYVRGRHAQLLETELLTGGSLGPVVSFQLDTAWEGLAKVAVFRRGSQKWDVALEGEPLCGIPREALAKAGGDLLVGIYGSDGEELAIPTVWVSAGPVKPGALPGGLEPGEQSGTLLEQLMAQFTSYVTQKNIWGGRVDALIEYLGSRIATLEVSDSGKAAAIQELTTGLADALEKAEHPAFPEEGTNAHVVPKLETLTGNVKVLFLNGNNPDGLPHTFTPVIRNVAAPQLEGDAANKAYVDDAIAAMAEEISLPAGGSDGQILRYQNGTPQWSNETNPQLIVSGRADNSDTSTFSIRGLSENAFAQIQAAISKGSCLPVFELVGPPVGLTRYLTLTHRESSYAQFSLPKIGTTGEGLLVRVTADGATGTKY